MSSLIGHAAAGVTVYLATNRSRPPAAHAALLTFTLLAICADFDYLGIWLFHYSPTPRITHTLIFALVAAVIAWLATRPIRKRGSAHLPFVALLAASLSHPLLDLLVGAHPLPLFWPSANADVSVPGILPSAGRLAVNNYYLWRNLLIELAVLLPAFALLVAIARQVPRHILAPRALLIAPFWLAFVVWSTGLAR